MSARFIVRNDGFGWPRVFDTERCRFVAVRTAASLLRAGSSRAGEATRLADEAKRLAAVLNGRGGAAPVRDMSMPEQLVLGEQD
jgi:hypothetical protein